MKAFEYSDICQMPHDSIEYSKTLLNIGKWIPASLIALFTDINHVFGSLFWIVGILWFCDFIIGTTRVWVDDDRKLEWGKSFRSVIKLIVMGVGVIAIYFIEMLVKESGVDMQGKLTAAVLMVMGTTEAVSVLDNLAWFFPQIQGIANKIKDILGKKSNGNGSNS